MLTFGEFSGLNNVLPEHRMGRSDLVLASDVDIGLTGDVSRRGGYSVEAEGCHKNLWQGAGFLLATCGSVLTAIHPDGSRHVIHPALGHERVWYCNLPDGRTTFSNGLIHGITDGLTGLPRGVAAPETLGSVDQAPGSLHPGTYRYYLTFVRAQDRLESPPIESAPVQVSQGGLRIDGLPHRDGHTVNVYLSGLDGEGAYLAGMAQDRSFEFGGTNSALVSECRTLGLGELPVGTVTAFWRGRVLVADGSTLWASAPGTPHLSRWSGFKQWGSPITAVCPVGGGIFVGTEQRLYFLEGDTWEGLRLRETGRGAVVLGSGISLPSSAVDMDERVSDGVGELAACIAGGELVIGFGGGGTKSLTDGRYRTDVREVWATFRELPGVGPQYLAVPL